ncbi:hypothetical protein [Lapidilactobacillus wuchangensis]|uniref:hypothetical protein n=1 Tax=Lapidilactobacillus wuchangensis TaxID=2486001 RepID=UPI0013DE478E|nr:hypothetical protein [Lapidilactobacillus wuchangensis]
MEGVVVSRQICLIALAIRQRLVLMTIWFVIGINRCRPRSTTSKPGMQSKPILFHRPNCATSKIISICDLLALAQRHKICYAIR